MNKREIEICTQIYEENKERLNWFMWRRFPWMNEEDRFDFMQDVWRILTENIETVGTWSKESQWAWLTKVCCNRVYTAQRKKSTVNFDADSDMVESLQLVSVEEEVIGKMMVEEILSGLTHEDEKLLFWKSSSKSSSKAREERERRSNADACKSYRTRKKLKDFLRRNGWDF